VAEHRQVGQLGEPGAEGGEGVSGHAWHPRWSIRDLRGRARAPADARIALERDRRDVVATRATLEGIRERIAEAGGTSPFAPAVDLGLRINQVMREWLDDQLAELAGKD
jgi:hypothetical protein